MQIRHPLPDSHRPRLLITGASTRAAAWSAIRAGFFPVCADRFGDEDLRQVAEVHDEADVRRQLQSGRPRLVTAARLNIADWVFDFSLMAAVEEECKSVDRYFGRLLGPNNMLLKRGISSLGKVLREQGFSALQERLGPFARDPFVTGLKQEACSPPRADGTWIEKPLSGGGGRSVRIWDQEAERECLPEPTYFQEYRPGQPMSAIFLADHHRSPAVELIGLTEQLVGDETAAAPTRFAYCGNIAPVGLPPEATQVVQRIGEVLAEKLGQRGIFGVDFIWDGTTPWVIEVNPRYTASCELLELAHGRALLRDHWRAWLPNEPLPIAGEPSPLPRPGVIGKLILYARSEVTAPDLSRFLRLRSAWTVPFLSDIPRVGTRFRPGEPMCTVFATGHDAAECRRKLVRRASRVRRWFGDLPEPIPNPSSVLD